MLQRLHSFCMICTILIFSIFQVPTRAEGPRRDVEYKKGEIFRFGQSLFFQLMSEKTFSFGQALFFKIGTRFLSENTALQNPLLRPKKTFSFGQALFNKIGTHFLSENAVLQSSVRRPEKTFSFGQALFF